MIRCVRVQSLQIPGLRKLLDTKALAVCLFAQDRLELDEFTAITTDVMYASYVEWALGQEPKQLVISKIAFGRLLENTIGLVPVSTRIKGTNVRLWRGIRLKDDNTVKIESDI